MKEVKQSKKIIEKYISRRNVALVLGALAGGGNIFGQYTVLPLWKFSGVRRRLACPCFLSEFSVVLSKL